ncbi:MAG: acyl-CoA dehydrogenase family protein [Planctomycetota bacterium]|jgi:alkylation response protein AidB-like acyl-CoA dehydrogenase
MANFFEDNEDIRFLFEHIDLRELATACEDGFAGADRLADRSHGDPGAEYAPLDADDAVDNYRRVLTITGDIAANTIAPRAERVDLDGNTLNDDGTVTLSEGMRENLEALSQGDLMGFTMPRRYGGLNCPTLLYTMAIEIVSRADASLMNIFGLQGIAETINAFADQSIKDEYLPRFTCGEVTAAMALTEPDAGSDLQAVSLRAWQDDDEQWRLTGVKRFITNGCGDVVLTLARSEPEIKDGRGLSLFLVDRGPRLKVRRLEEKLGIHGSPTCELVYDDVPAKLVGERQLGLIRYVAALMNGARLGVAAQGLGIAEATFRVARRYAHTRKQFGASIEKLPAVAEMVTEMKIAIEAARALVYETARVCDLENNNLRVLETNPPADKDELKKRKQEARVFKRLNGMLTPMCKYYASEMCVSVSNDALQVLGGSGYMTDYPVERHLRDARITSIYEGTSQLQIVAAVRGVCSGTFEKRIEEIEQAEYFDKSLCELKQKLVEGKGLILEAIRYVKQHGVDYMDLCGRKLVDAAITVLIGHLFLQQAADDRLESRSDSEDSPFDNACNATFCASRKKLVAHRFIKANVPTLTRDMTLVCSGDKSALTDFDTLAGPPPAAS